MTNWIIFLWIHSRWSTYVQIEFMQIIRLGEEKCDRKPIRLRLVSKKTNIITMEKAYLRVMRCGNEVMIQGMIHFLRDASIVRIKDITFGWKKIIGKTWTLIVSSKLCYSSFTHRQYRDDPDTSLRKKVRILGWSLHISRVSLSTSNQTMQIRWELSERTHPLFCFEKQCEIFCGKEVLITRISDEERETPWDPVLLWARKEELPDE